MHPSQLCSVLAAVVIPISLSAANGFCGASYCVMGDVSVMSEKVDGGDFIVNYLKIDAYEASVYEGGNPLQSGANTLLKVNGLEWHVKHKALGTRFDTETGFKWPRRISVEVKGINRSLAELEQFIARFQLNPELPEVENFSKPSNG